MVTSKKIWAAVVAILLATALVPAMAKAPVSLALAGVFLVPLVRRLQDPEVVAIGQSQRLHDPAQGVGFTGSIERKNGSRPSRWRQVRCLIKDSELLIYPYWQHQGQPEVISIRASRIESVTPSRASDGLKPGVLRVIDLKLADTASLRLAVDAQIAQQVRAALEAHA
ncbi:hypothetical protein [Pedococcus sp. 5OH_020]|uniref:hypothetical protein n=1 Tax=Pedococcus sp. 5OH_020 TaxID=2989814 RepID=UPI0022E9F322|nr:hypothetical protein [Pedococcus sp. 5OH_020]